MRNKVYVFFKNLQLLYNTSCIQFYLNVKYVLQPEIQWKNIQKSFWINLNILKQLFERKIVKQKYAESEERIFESENLEVCALPSVPRRAHIGE